MKPKGRRHSFPDFARDYNINNTHLRIMKLELKLTTTTRINWNASKTKFVTERRSCLGLRSLAQ